MTATAAASRPRSCTPTGPCSAAMRRPRSRAAVYDRSFACARSCSLLTLHWSVQSPLAPLMSAAGRRLLGNSNGNGTAALAAAPGAGLSALMSPRNPQLTPQQADALRANEKRRKQQQQQQQQQQRKQPSSQPQSQAQKQS